METKNNWKAWLYLAPALILMLVFTFYPLFNTFLIAFLKNYDYANEFPAIGDENIIYKAEKEQSLYQFNAETYKYEKLSDSKGIDNIQIINGGKA